MDLTNNPSEKILLLLYDDIQKQTMIEYSIS